MKHIPMNPNHKVDNNEPVSNSLMDVVIYPVLIVLLALGTLAVVKYLI